MLEAITHLKEAEKGSAVLIQKSVEAAHEIMENAKAEVAMRQKNMLDIAHDKYKSILSKAEQDAISACEPLETQAVKSLNTILNPSKVTLDMVSDILVKQLLEATL